MRAPSEVTGLILTAGCGWNFEVLSSDGGLLVMRELDGALGLSDLAATALSGSIRGKNTTHRLDGQFRQSVYGRLAGYEDVNDADRLALDPVMRQVVADRAVDAHTPCRLCRFQRPSDLAATPICYVFCYAFSWRQSV